MWVLNKTYCRCFLLQVNVHNVIMFFVVGNGSIQYDIFIDIINLPWHDNGDPGNEVVLVFGRIL